MAGLLLPSLVALVLALARGGSIRNWSRAQVLGWPLVVGVLALELVLYNPPVDREPWAMWIGPWLWLATRLLLLGVLLVNGVRARHGAWAWRIAAFGMSLNTLAIVVNGGHMPQSAVAAMAVWGPGYAVSTTHLENVVVLSAQTPFAWLGDVIAEPNWLPRANVVSVGDVLLALGVAGWLFYASQPQPVEIRRDIVGRIGTPVHGAARPARRCAH